MLKAMVGKYLKSDDKSKPAEMYPPIEEEDMIKIRAYFDRKKPQNLQDEVAFNCLCYFGLRGRETLRYLEKTSFNFSVYGQGFYIGLNGLVDLWCYIRCW